MTLKLNSILVASIYILVTLCSTTLLSQSTSKPKYLEPSKTSIDSGLQAIQRFDATDLKNLPFRTQANDYYQLFNGLYAQDYRGNNLLHGRGSRDDELAYSFEGADIRSAFTGLPVIRFIPEALQQIAFDSGPIASIDNAPAILRHSLRRGSQKFKLAVQGESDRFTSKYRQRLNTFSYGYENYLILSEGSLFTENITFLAAAEHEKFKDHYAKFWQGFSLGDAPVPLVDNITGETFQDVFEREGLTLLAGNIPEANSSRTTINSHIAAKFSNLTARLIGLYNSEKEQANSSPIRHIFNPERIPLARKSAGLLSAQMDYKIDASSEAHLQFDVFEVSEKTQDPIFEDAFLLYRDSLAIVEKGLDWQAPEEVRFDTYITGPGKFIFNSFEFDRPGELIANYSKWAESQWRISGFFQKKVNNHLLSLGGRFEKRKLRYFSIGSSFGYSKKVRALGGASGSFSEDEMITLRDDGDVRTYGYDLLGKPIEAGDTVTDGPKRPTHFSFFLQDHIRSQNFGINIGLRYDVFSNDALVFRNPENPEIIGGQDPNILPGALAKSPSERYLSPRINLEYSYSEQLNFDFTYGQYVQRVKLRDVYASRQTRIQNLVEDTFGLIRNTRGNASTPVTSKQLSFATRYKPTPAIRLRAAAFLKTINGHLQMEEFSTLPNAPVTSYLIYSNSGETDAKGMELGLRYEYKGWNGWFNYTFSDTEGFYSYPISNLTDLKANTNDISGGIKSELDYNQKHRGNFLLNYNFDGSKVKLLTSTAIHLLFSFNSGHSQSLYDGRPG